MDKNNIKSQLSANAKALEWGSVYLKGKELSDFRSRLIENRIKLKRLEYALSVNPAAAIFGESQVGKSYMVDCLLTSETEVLNVYDGEGKPTGFLESINPLGGGKEATSLISRFTASKVWIDPEYPIKATMLTPIDVVIVLLDTYFNDVKNHEFPKEAAIKEEIERIKRTYRTTAPVQDAITEDEIFELKMYLTSGLVERGEAFREKLIENHYYEELAAVISHISVEQWADVFQFLWNDNRMLTNIFNKLIESLRQMGFCRTVYIKMDAILRRHGTILHVDRLYELMGISEVINEKGEKRRVEQAPQPLMSVLTEKGNKIEGIQKSIFCALSMELALTMVDPSDNSKNSSILVEKPFLKDSDILDFPGARSRKMIQANTISETDVCEMILRGKVAYLFNKYSQQYLITNLLFCHHDTKSEVVTLSSLLQGWVESTIGKTPEDRENFMKVAEISPLFLIGTKFNIDLKKIPDDSKGEEQDRKNARNYRWAKRFEMLENLIGPSITNTWLKEWTPNAAFNNIYLLRSFEYSCQDGIYIGYQEKDSNGLWNLVYKDNQKLRGETCISDDYEPFISKLKESFLENGFVRDHFANPQKSWDEAVAVGKDGSAWIIENLTRSSNNMSKSRDTQFSKVSHETFNTLVNALYELYHDDNSDLELQKQVQTAGAISFTFDVLFGKDKYFFSDFISRMVVDEEELHDVVMDIVNSTKVVNETDLSTLFAIRSRAKIDNNLPFEENVRRLLNVYPNCRNEEDLRAELAKYGLTIEDVINPPKVMNFSRLISSAVEKSWTTTYLSVERYQDFIARGLGEKELKNLLDNTRVLYCDKMKISSYIAQKIHPFVSSSTSVDDMSDMLADICAETINKFINTMGSAFYDDEMWENIKSAINHNSFDINIEAEKAKNIIFDDEETRMQLPVVFDTFDNVDKILNEVPVNKEKLQHFSNYIEYYRWSELMKVSFLATRGIPKYDVNMNNALRKLIIDQIIHQEHMNELASKHPKLQTLETVKE